MRRLGALPDLTVSYSPPPGPNVFYAGGNCDGRTYMLNVASQTWTFVANSYGVDLGALANG